MSGVSLQKGWRCILQIEIVYLFQARKHPLVLQEAHQTNKVNYFEWSSTCWGQNWQRKSLVCHRDLIWRAIWTQTVLQCPCCSLFQNGWQCVLERFKNPRMQASVYARAALSSHTCTPLKCLCQYRFHNRYMKTCTDENFCSCARLTEQSP